jgi:hypothetical protein
MAERAEEVTAAVIPGRIEDANYDVRLRTSENLEIPGLVLWTIPE